MSRIIKAGTPECSLKTLPITLRPIGVTEVRPLGRGNGDGELALSMLDKARLESDIILRSARAEAETIREQARAEGYAAGIAEGAAASQTLITKLESQIAECESEIQSFFDSIEPQVLKLCVEAVEKITRHEIKTDPRVVLRAIRSCLRRIKDCDEVRVRLSPRQVAQVRAEREELLSLVEGVRAINIIEDRRVSPGGCIMESGFGDFEATVEAQLDRVEQRIMETFDNDRDSAGSGFGEIPQSDQQDGHDPG